MYRENAPPPPPDPMVAAAQAVKNCAHIQIGIAVLYVVNFVLLLLQFSFYKPPANLQIPADVVSEWRVTALIVGAAAVVIFGTWGVLNAWALGKKKKIARWSSIAFAAATMVNCCFWPFGGFLLYMMLRRDVKAYFD